MKVPNTVNGSDPWIPSCSVGASPLNNDNSNAGGDAVPLTEAVSLGVTLDVAVSLGVELSDGVPVDVPLTAAVTEAVSLDDAVTLAVGVRVGNATYDTINSSVAPTPDGTDTRASSKQYGSTSNVINHNRSATCSINSELPSTQSTHPVARIHVNDKFDAYMELHDGWK